MYRMHGAFGGLRVVETNGFLTGVALLRRCRDGPGRSVVRSSMANKAVPFLKSV